MPNHQQMKMFICRVLLVLSVQVGASAIAQDVRNSVVQITVKSSSMDLLYPWRQGYAEESVGSGVIIDGHRILTAAHVVDNALMLDVRRVGSAKRAPAKVLYRSDERDLAIITVDDPEFFKGAEPIALGSMPRLAEDITVWGFPGGDQLAITKGIVSRIEFAEYVYSGHSNLVVQVDAAMNGGASGGAAISDGKLAGINFQSSENAEGEAFIVPVPVVQQFLKDIEDGEVNGVPNLAIWFKQMLNPQLREHFGLVGGQSGLLITRVAGIEAASGVFKPGDIIMSLDGEAIADDGTVTFADGDRIDYDWLIARRQVGDVIFVTLLRDGEVENVHYTLQYSRQQSLQVKHHASGLKADYQVIGGLVFQSLNSNYIQNAFKKEDVPAWMTSASLRYRELPLGEKEQLVFIADILPDAINQGYESYVDEPLKSVNGMLVRSMDDLRAGLADASDSLRLTFANEAEGIVVFNKKSLAERDPLIRKQYGY